MGVAENITASRFPRQGPYLGAHVKVCFHYDTSVLIGGSIVRDDAEAPWQTIIRTTTGLYLRATECQYSIVSLAEFRVLAQYNPSSEGVVSPEGVSLGGGPCASSRQ